MRNTYSWNYNVLDQLLTIWENRKSILATIDCENGAEVESLFKKIVWELRGIDLDKEGATND